MKRANSCRLMITYRGVSLASPSLKLTHKVTLPSQATPYLNQKCYSNRFLGCHSLYLNTILLSSQHINSSSIPFSHLSRFHSNSSHKLTNKHLANNRTAPSSLGQLRASNPRLFNQSKLRLFSS